jgi:pyruvate dehydrogenase complex dehydrogenase (E1) component
MGGHKAGQHIELGIAENNLFLMLAALGLAGDPFGPRLFPIGTVYDRSLPGASMRSTTPATRTRDPCWGDAVGRALGWKAAPTVDKPAADRHG